MNDEDRQQIVDSIRARETMASRNPFFETDLAKLFIKVMEPDIKKDDKEEFGHFTKEFQLAKLEGKTANLEDLRFIEGVYKYLKYLKFLDGAAAVLKDDLEFCFQSSASKEGWGRELLTRYSLSIKSDKKEKNFLGLNKN